MTPFLLAKRRTGFPRSHRWHHRESILGKRTEMLHCAHRKVPVFLPHWKLPAKLSRHMFMRIWRATFMRCHSCQISWHHSDEIQSTKSSLSYIYTSLKIYQPPKHCTAMYRTLRQDFNQSWGKQEKYMFTGYACACIWLATAVLCQMTKHSRPSKVESGSTPPPDWSQGLKSVRTWP